LTIYITNKFSLNMLADPNSVLYIRSLGEFERLDSVKSEMDGHETVTCLTNMDAIRDHLWRELGPEPCSKRYIQVEQGDTVFVLAPAVPLAKVGRFITAGDVDRLVRKGWMAFYKVEVLALEDIFG